jgi:hypothetical protein
LKLNISHIIKKTLEISGALFSMIAIVLSFVSWDDIEIKNMCNRIGILVGIIVLSLLISAVYIIFVKNSRVVWQCGNGKIVLAYSDIIKEGFAKKIKDERIVVIPVNTCFDTIIDYDVSLVEKPIVSPNTIHGQWLTSMNNIGISQDELNQRIKEYIKQKGIQSTYELTRNVKKRGNLLSYERGTVVPVKVREKVTFFLLALSEFDDNNKGQCSKDEFVDCIKKLIEFYNNHGQGFELYLPLMGTNLSRVGMSHSEALHKIRAIIELYNDRIHGMINIIVYNKDKEMVSIFD